LWSVTWVGRVSYLGLMIYDADAVGKAAAVKDEHALYEAQKSVFLDPHDPAVVAAARAADIPDDWITAAQRSPIWDLIMKYEVALPLHPEYRTMPMVWYIPPLSPVVDVLRDTGHDGEDVHNLFGAVDALRIPLEYLAGLFTAGDTEPVRAVLNRLGAMRSYQRRINLGESRDESIAASVGMTGAQMDAMYRLLAIAKYDDRYVIPAAHAEDAHRLEQLGTECSLEYEGGPGMYQTGPFGEASGAPVPVQVETFHMLRDRQTADEFTDAGDEPRRVNLLNWDGKGRPAGLFPPRRGPDSPRRPEDQAPVATQPRTDGHADD